MHTRSLAELRSIAPQLSPWVKLAYRSRCSPCEESDLHIMQHQSSVKTAKCLLNSLGSWCRINDWEREINTKKKAGSIFRYIWHPTKCALCFGASWLILGSSVAECLTASSTVTGRLCFHVSAGDDRLRRARAVPVCPGNVFVFILCLRETFLSFSPSVPKKREGEKKKCEMLCARACVRVEHTCYEVAARRGLRNNPSVISISKPHLCVWLNMKSQLPLLAFVEQLMPNLAKKKKQKEKNLFFCVRACVDTHGHISNYETVLAKAAYCTQKGLVCVSAHFIRTLAAALESIRGLLFVQRFARRRGCFNQSPIRLHRALLFALSPWKEKVWSEKL